VLAIVLTIAVPLARAVPEWRGAALWLTLAAIRRAAILVAAFLDRGITKVRNAKKLALEVPRRARSPAIEDGQTSSDTDQSRIS
jgi:hypothetical protein